MNVSANTGASLSYQQPVDNTGTPDADSTSADGSSYIADPAASDTADAKDSRWDVTKPANQHKLALAGGIGLVTAGVAALLSKGPGGGTTALAIGAISAVAAGAALLGWGDQIFKKESSSPDEQPYEDVGSTSSEDGPQPTGPGDSGGSTQVDTAVRDAFGTGTIANDALAIARASSRSPQDIETILRSIDDAFTSDAREIDVFRAAMESARSRSTSDITTIVDAAKNAFDDEDAAKRVLVTALASPRSASSIARLITDVDARHTGAGSDAIESEEILRELTGYGYPQPSPGDTEVPSPYNPYDPSVPIDPTYPSVPSQPTGPGDSPSGRYEDLYRVIEDAFDSDAVESQARSIALGSGRSFTDLITMLPAIDAAFTSDSRELAVFAAATQARHRSGAAVAALAQVANETFDDEDAQARVLTAAIQSPIPTTDVIQLMRSVDAQYHGAGADAFEERDLLEILAGSFGYPSYPSYPGYPGDGTGQGDSPSYPSYPSIPGDPGFPLPYVPTSPDPSYPDPSYPTP